MVGPIGHLGHIGNGLFSASTKVVWIESLKFIYFLLIQSFKTSTEVAPFWTALPLILWSFWVKCVVPSRSSIGAHQLKFQLQWNRNKNMGGRAKASPYTGNSSWDTPVSSGRWGHWRLKPIPSIQPTEILAISALEWTSVIISSDLPTSDKPLASAKAFLHFFCSFTDAY